MIKELSVLLTMGILTASCSKQNIKEKELLFKEVFSKYNSSVPTEEQIDSKYVDEFNKYLHDNGIVPNGWHGSYEIYDLPIKE